MTRRQRRTALGLVAATLGLTFAISGLTVAAPPVPPAGTFSFTWLKHGCFATREGSRSIATIRTEVKYLAQPGKTHYQEVKVQIDRQAGHAGGFWRQVDSKVYDWSRFNGRGLPARSTSAVRTGLQPDAGTLTAKATVWLKRVRRGPDKTVWRYRARSAPFTCFTTGLATRLADPVAGVGAMTGPDA